MKRGFMRSSSAALRELNVCYRVGMHLRQIQGLVQNTPLTFLEMSNHVGFLALKHPCFDPPPVLQLCLRGHVSTTHTM